MATTHVFIVDTTTFKIHLEYLFAGTGAGDRIEVNKISLNNNLKYRIYDSVCKDYIEKIKNLDNLTNKEKTLLMNYLIAIKRTYIKLMNNKNIGSQYESVVG